MPKWHEPEPAPVECHVTLRLLDQFAFDATGLSPNEIKATLLSEVGTRLARLGTKASRGTFELDPATGHYYATIQAPLRPEAITEER